MKKILFVAFLFLSISAHAKTIFLDCTGKFVLCSKHENKNVCDKPLQRKIFLSFDGKSTSGDEDTFVTFKNTCEEIGDKIICKDSRDNSKGGAEPSETNSRVLNINRLTGALNWNSDTSFTPIYSRYEKGDRGFAAQYEAECSLRTNKRLF